VISAGGSLSGNIGGGVAEFADGGLMM